MLLLRPDFICAAISFRAVAQLRRGPDDLFAGGGLDPEPAGPVAQHGRDGRGADPGLAGDIPDR